MQVYKSVPVIVVQGHLISWSETISFLCPSFWLSSDLRQGRWLMGKTVHIGQQFNRTMWGKVIEVVMATLNCGICSEGRVKWAQHYSHVEYLCPHLTRFLTEVFVL